jgi:hypothetical protein
MLSRHLVVALQLDRDRGGAGVDLLGRSCKGFDARVLRIGGGIEIERPLFTRRADIGFGPQPDQRFREIFRLLVQHEGAAEIAIAGHHAGVDGIDDGQWIVGDRRGEGAHRYRREQAGSRGEDQGAARDHEGSFHREYRVVHQTSWRCAGFNVH